MPDSETTVPEIEPDLTPPSGRQRVGDLLGRASKTDGDTRKQTRKGNARKPQPTMDLETLETELIEGYQFLALMLGPMAPNGAAEMFNRAERNAAAWVRLAEHSPRVYKALTMFTEGSGWFAIAAGHAPIAVAILQDLNRKPEDGEPETMAEQVARMMDEPAA